VTISLCITSHGRLWQLRQTLFANLALYADNPKVQFVLLNYNSPDDLHVWAAKNLREFIAAGRLIYVHERTASHFHASKAKNLAHRFGTNDILFNLDGDNWADGVYEVFRERPRRILHLKNGRDDGTCGRVGMPREWFYRLGGYDESFDPMGYQDNDLFIRGREMGLASIKIKGWKPAIANTLAEKTALTDDPLKPWATMVRENNELSDANIAAGRFAVNQDGWGSGEVSVNFGPYKVLDVIRPPASMVASPS
jgi:hypothetical protein